MTIKFTGHLALKLGAAWRSLDETNKRDVAQQAEAVFAGRAAVLRGAYLTQGYRADTDILLWMYADSADDIQDAQLALRQTPLGRLAETPHAFMGVTLESEFNKSHVPAFIRGLDPLEYICFYPFIRTPEWYLLPEDERRSLLAEHGVFGREYPAVRTNNVHAFGLGDFEWLLSFETDDLVELAQMVRRQRAAGARAFTKYEWPFIVGRRTGFAQALAKC